MTAPPSKYDNWSREDLIARLARLDRPEATPPVPYFDKAFSFADYGRRKIALKFCYAGWEYNGLEHQLDPTPLPTVEGALFEALAHARIVDSAAGFDGCGWEKCGRTDRGVSAAGQVVSFWARSNLAAFGAAGEGGAAVVEGAVVSESADEDTVDGADGLVGDIGLMEDYAEAPSRPRKPMQRELAYVSILNRILPPTIRALAWAPVAPTFSARFACRYRHYKYFFSPAGLDIARMRDAAARLVGEHDFRNLCKLDPSKQITSFLRRILRADIGLVDGHSDQYVLDLVGTAFLYHQVRHIMAVLFLVGTGLEHPSVVSSLLNVDREHPYKPREGDPPLEVVECKPEYQMADALPLMLWDCSYSDTDVQWQTGSDTGDEDAGSDNAPHGTRSSLYSQMEAIHERSVTHTMLDAHFFAAAAAYHPPPPRHFPLGRTGVALPAPGKRGTQIPFQIPLGGGTFRRATKYLPLLQRNRLRNIEVANERWRTGKGQRREERRKAAEQATGDNGDE